MIPLFFESAIRSLLLGLAVFAGLRIFRVRNVLAQKAAWGLVLASAVVMPLLLPVAAKWQWRPAGFNIAVPAHPMTLLEELQARIVAKAGSSAKLTPTAAAIPPSDAPDRQAPEQAGSPKPSKTSPPAANTRDAARPDRYNSDRAPSASAALPVLTGSPIRELPSVSPVRHIPTSPGILVLMLYCGVAAFLFIRVALGLFRTICLWRSATPIPAHDLPADAARFPLRASNKVTSPFTIGSAILLPADYKDWDREKLRIVLAHEGSHIRQGDFYLQLLAGIYSALFWFSPLGWWLKHALAELAEAISDHAGMEQAASRTSYAQILLEFAAAPRQITIGVAMARPGSLSRRIERLLNDNSFRQCFAGGRRALVAVVLVPVALFACTTLVRVEAAATAAPAYLAAPQLNSMQAEPAASAPAAEAPSETMAAVSPAPAMGLGGAVAGGGVEQTGSLTFDRTLSVSGNAQLDLSTGSGNIHITRGSGNQIQIHGKIRVSREGSEEQAREIAANPPIEQSGDTIHVGQHQEQWHGISIDYEVEAPAGTVLNAISGSGDIVDEGVGQNAKLETGSGDISATSLEGPFTVKTGSGNITAAQTGQGDVVAETGSGDIELKDIHGGFRGQTGSGDIKASGTPSASWMLQTGSGNIELSTGNAPLTLDASTGSGSVITDHEMVVQGTFDRHHIHGNLNGGGPTLRIQTGSGDIHIH